MNTRILLTVLAIFATAAVTAPSMSGAATPFKKCSGSFDPGGKAGGGFYRNITAKRVTCTTARAVTKAWILEPQAGNPTKKKKFVKGYSCTSTAVFPDPGRDGFLKTLCVRDGAMKAVRFTSAP